MEEEIEIAIKKLIHWIEIHQNKAFDPFDGLNAWVRPLAFGKLGRQLLQQGVRRFPINLRPLLGIPPSLSSKGMGFLARGYLKLFLIFGQDEHRQKAINCLDWLLENPSRGYRGLCWGNHFDYQSRVFYLPAGEPTVVWTALIGYAFLDAYEILGDENYLDASKKVCNFILNSLEHRTEDQGVCISYIPSAFHAVHNANMLGAAMLARTSFHTGDKVLQNRAHDAVAYTVGAQRNNGSWWYGEAENLHWLDNFHSGYVLDSLMWYIKSTGDTEFQPAYEFGADYFCDKFFTEAGIPKYYSDRIYPIDIQCCAQAIETLSLISQNYRPDTAVDALQVATWTVRNMQDKDGHFWFQRYPGIINKTPMLHWGQATMFHALSYLFSMSNLA